MILIKAEKNQCVYNVCSTKSGLEIAGHQTNTYIKVIVTRVLDPTAYSFIHIQIVFFFHPLPPSTWLSST